MHGYIHILRNNGTAEGICGINMLASYPIKTSPNPSPPPFQGSTKCYIFSSCEKSQTCCCSWRLYGICLGWNCCTAKDAVCCDNRKHCCPSTHPICDTVKGRCLKVRFRFPLFFFFNFLSFGKIKYCCSHSLVGGVMSIYSIVWCIVFFFFKFNTYSFCLLHGFDYVFPYHFFTT